MKLSEELKHCLDGNGCSNCICKDENDVILTCKEMLRKVYEELKKHEGTIDGDSKEKSQM